MTLQIPAASPANRASASSQPLTQSPYGGAYLAPSSLESCVETHNRTSHQSRPEHWQFVIDKFLTMA